MERLPTLFLSHGSPMLALENEKTDEYVKTLIDLRWKLPIPKAILNIGAHWYWPYKKIDISEFPETIYDFYWFPKELYNIKYKARWYPKWEKLVKDSIPELKYEPVQRWLDHGTWTMLMHLFPDANIPVFSISIDSKDSFEKQFELWRKLRVLRDSWILIITNWNIVHNLWTTDFNLDKNKPYLFASDFDLEFKELLLNKDYSKLLNPHELKWWIKSNPTLDHYIPAIITIWTSYPEEIVQNIFEWFELGSIWRRSFWFGI